MHLKMSSAEVACCKYLPNITDELSVEANNVDLEQIYRSSLIWVHTVCIRGKADDFCCDWRIKG